MEDNILTRLVVHSKLNFEKKDLTVSSQTFSSKGEGSVKGGIANDLLLQCDGKILYRRGTERPRGIATWSGLKRGFWQQS